jgi:hypothetical protein
LNRSLHYVCANLFLTGKRGERSQDNVLGVDFKEISQSYTALAAAEAVGS